MLTIESLADDSLLVLATHLEPRRGGEVHARKTAEPNSPKGGASQLQIADEAVGNDIPRPLLLEGKRLIRHSGLPLLCSQRPAQRHEALRIGRGAREGQSPLHEPLSPPGNRW